MIYAHLLRELSAYKIKTYKTVLFGIFFVKDML
jgi:hypothetical protein